MKRVFLWITFVFILGFGTSAQRLTIVKTGRPNSFEYNNAEKVAGVRWNIQFRYFAFDGKDFDALDSINVLNKKSEDKLVAKHGIDWNEQFRKEVDSELKKQNELRQLIYVYPSSGQGEELPLIHFEQGHCRNHYKAFCFLLVPTANLSAENFEYQVIRVLKVNAKRKKIKPFSLKCAPLHLSYPENGIN